MKKTVFAAFVGRPNVGKSSLINCLVGKDISIVSKKPQTTRNKIAGIKTLGLEQFVFFDTPGLFKFSDILGKRMVKSIKEAILDVDCGVLVVEPKFKINDAEKKIIETFYVKKIPLILAINKIDIIKNKTNLAAIVQLFNENFKFDAVVFVSAKNKDGLNTLLLEISKFEVESEHFFPSDFKTDKSDQFIVSEIFRQKLLLNLDKEIPHSLMVEVDYFKKTKTNLQISVIIYCLKENHKGIIVGKKGLLIKKIATESRKAIEHFFNCKVYLKCWVKVKLKLNENDQFLKRFV